MYVVEGEKVPDDLYEQNNLSHHGGTIHDITGQISNLDANLHSYNSPSQLVVDKYMEKHGLQDEEDEDEQFGFGKLIIDYKFPKKSPRNISNKEVEAKEVTRFAGVYSVRSVLQGSTQNPLADTTLPQTSSLALKKVLKKKAEKSSSIKPMLVELHVYPGYEPDAVTPLPPPLLVREILMTVVDAQKDLKKKPSFKCELQSLLFSKTSEAILQDLFWWYFLEKYQPSKNIQEMLFNRIAHNYVKVLFTAPVTEYRDTFLKRYPSLLAQAVYCTFCTAFPTSYKQFGDEFKEDLIQLVTEWIFGTKPVPRVWEKWNLKGLEPTDMRKDEQIKQDASKGSLVSLPAELSEESLSKHGGLSTTGIRLSQKSLPLIVEERASTIGSPGTKRKSMAINKTTPHSSVTNIGESRDSFNRLAPRNATENDSLTSVSLTRLQGKDSAISFIGRPNRIQKRKESCPVGRGPEFSRSVFDVHGHSPLVEQFFRMKNLAKDSGASVLIQRTEIKSLPSVSAPTYRDLIKKSLKFSQTLTSDFKKMEEENSRQRTLFTRTQKELNRDFTRREGELLSRHKDVKKLSELIYLEITKDGDEHSSGKVAAAIASAMGFGTENEAS